MKVYQLIKELERYPAGATIEVKITATNDYIDLVKSDGKETGLYTLEAIAAGFESDEDVEVVTIVGLHPKKLKQIDLVEPDFNVISQAEVFKHLVP